MGAWVLINDRWYYMARIEIYAGPLDMTRRLPIIFILITVMIDSMGIGLIMPVMPDLIQEVRGGDLGQAAIWGGILATSFAVMQFTFGPTLGNLSDRFGRRVVLLLSLFFLTIDYLIMALAGTITLLLIGRLIGGITSATQATAGAFMADISKPGEKAANFGLIGAAFGVGFVLGPMIGGLLAEYGTRAPFYAAALLAGANFIFGYLTVTETVTDAIRRPFQWCRANPLGAFKHLGMKPGLGRLFIVFFFLAIAFFVYPAVWAYYGQERFGWGPAMIGLSLGLFGISVAIGQGLLIRPILKAIGERNAVFMGLTVDITAFSLFAVLENGWIALAITPFIGIASVSGPAMQAIMSKIADDDQQGELQGAFMSVNAVAMIIAPIVMTQAFWYFTTGPGPIYLPGAPFAMAALLTSIALAIFAASRTKELVTV